MISGRNFNVAITGHVDSGKTTLSKTLSTLGSTNSFDKSAESQKRGMTIDLGVSMWNSNDHSDRITFIDCPGHAEFIKTVICGIAVCDLVIIVIDALKGFQQQTYESFIFSQIFDLPIVIVLSKIDTIVPESQKKRCSALKKVIQSKCDAKGLKLWKIFEFSIKNENINNLRYAICSSILNKLEKSEKSDIANSETIFLYDHAFPKNNSTYIFTGNIIKGSIQINDTLEIPKYQIDGKVKSINSFAMSLNEAIKGDRIGISLVSPYFSGIHDLKQRGLACTKATLRASDLILCTVIFFKNSGNLKSNTLFTISALNETFSAMVLFYDPSSTKKVNDKNYFKILNEANTEHNHDVPNHFEVLLKVEKKLIYLPKNCTYIGLNNDLINFEDKSHSRILFYGKIKSCHKLNDKEIRFYKEKSLVGTVERLTPEGDIIIKDLFTAKHNIKYFINMKILINGDISAYIIGPFGNKGKLISRPINRDLKNIIKDSKVQLQYYKSKDHENIVFQ